MLLHHVRRVNSDECIGVRPRYLLRLLLRSNHAGYGGSGIPRSLSPTISASFPITKSSLSGNMMATTRRSVSYYMEVNDQHGQKMRFRT
ncbi:hypothetical protein RRG08_040113 [Elysia crispata]|uniref:Uncharacterized protein n=1 Tax=Elysia crispata TaxID=231223 RepID=A0AAE1CN30_9GAST|nr:hypothetical protein RRG08_040113 [Elysia crispata]